MIAATLVLDVLLRGRVVRVFFGISSAEPRRAAPYRDIPFAAQPKTVRYVGGLARIAPGEPVRLQVFGESRTYFGRLSRVPRPKGE